MPARELSPWDAQGVAERIDGYWRSSTTEAVHVAALGDLCARRLTSRRLRVVEVGCGTGRIYEQLVPRLLPESGYTGVDLSGRMLAMARRRWPAARFVRCDGRVLALADDAVDYALAFEVIGHLDEPRPLLAELGRVGRLGFMFTVWPATEEEGVRDGRESVGASEFLHRRYPASWMAAEIEAALPGRSFGIEIAATNTGTWAYLVARRSGPPGVTMPRRMPAAGPPG
jgi:ubiquinone/menaquinone biosynthesis C-methylase UbiE